MILHLLRVRKISVSIVSHSGLNTLHLYLVACLGYWTLWFSWQHQCIVIIKCTFQLGKYQVQLLFCRWGGRSLENEDVAAPIFQDLYQSHKTIKSENGWNKIQPHRQWDFHVKHGWKERHIIINSSLHMTYSDLLLVMLYLMLVFIRPWKNQSIEEIKFKNMNLVTCFGGNTCKNGLFTPSCAPRPYSRVYLGESLNWGHNTSSTYTALLYHRQSHHFKNKNFLKHHRNNRPRHHDRNHHYILSKVLAWQSPRMKYSTIGSLNSHKVQRFRTWWWY